MSPADPHKDCVLHFAGAPLSKSRAVVLAVHGRYGTTADILKLADQVDVADVAWVAPQADGNSWWGNSFLAPLATNEPGLTSSLRRFSVILDELAGKGFGPDDILLTGFSQGACLVLEHVARHPKRWHGIVAMSGGLLGTSDCDSVACDRLNGHSPKAFDYTGDLGGLPIHLGCHQEDPVIPVARVRESKRVLEKLGAHVSLDVENGKMHGIRQSDILALRNMLRNDQGVDAASS